MSVASERKAMRETLQRYSLMPVGECAEFMDDCDPRTARRKLEEAGVPNVGGLYDPVDFVAYLLAEREGCTFDEYHDRHGDAVPEHVRRYMQRIRRAVPA